MNKSVVIGLPTYRGDFHPRMTLSLDRLIQHTQKERPDIKLGVKKYSGTILADNRNQIVKRAIEVGANHVLFIDSDMCFDEDALLQLLACDRDIVSGLCTIKSPPYHPVALRRNEGGGWTMGDRSKYTEGRFFSDLDGVGMAFTLIKTEVFRKVEEPWFAMPPLCMVDSYRSVHKAEKGLRMALTELVHQDNAVGVDVIQSLLDSYAWKEVDHGKHGLTVMGEDIFFCDKARHADFEVCLDSSLIIGHIGEHVYTIEDYKEYKKQREEDKKEPKKVDSAA